MGTLIFFTVFASYLFTGWLLGDLQLQVWTAKENRSKRAFLLFPLSFYRQRVGEDNVNFLSIFDWQNKTKGASESPGTGMFKVIVALGWPLLMAYNVLMATLIFLLTRSNLLMGRDTSVTSVDVKDTDSVPELFKKRRAIIAEMRRLQLRKDLADAEIQKRKRVVDTAVELEEQIDSDIAAIQAEDLEADRRISKKRL